jgi:hypothetical protein
VRLGYTMCTLDKVGSKADRDVLVSVVTSPGFTPSSVQSATTSSALFFAVFLPLTSLGARRQSSTVCLMGLYTHTVNSRNRELQHKRLNPQCQRAPNRRPRLPPPPTARCTKVDRVVVREVVVSGYTALEGRVRCQLLEAHHKLCEKPFA